jgi:acyl-CoA synthetase (AMP-forming)/AMP-acid ligase II
VAVFIEDPIFHAIVLIALTRLGIVTISGTTRGFSWRFAIDAVVADQPFEFPAGKVILAHADWTLGDADAREQQYLYRAAPGDVCRIVLASGTNGKENAVAVTNRTMAARINNQKLFFGPQAPFCTRTWLDLPLTTSLGFQVLLAGLWRGGAVVMTGDPEKTIDALPAYKVQNMVGSPRTLLEAVESIEKRAPYRCGFEAVFVTGSSLPEDLSTRVRSRICSNLTRGYESPEATMVAAMPAHFAPGTAGAVGYALPGIIVEIVDGDDRALPSERDGVVRIKSEYGASEYLEDPAETQRVFRNGWFYPGDFGYLTHENMLVISGRSVDAP